MSQSPSRPQGGPQEGAGTAAGGNQVSQFAELIVRDFLESRDLHQALKIFDQEVSSKRDTAESLESWYTLSSQIDLPSLLRSNSQQPDSRRHGTMLEMLVDRLLLEENMKLRAPVGVSVHHRSEVLDFHMNTHKDHWPRMPEENIVSTDRQAGRRHPFPPDVLLDDKFKAQAKDAEPQSLGSREGNIRSGKKYAAKSTKRPGRPRKSGGYTHTPAVAAGLRAKRSNDTSKHMSSEAWIPADVRTRMLERDLTLLKHNMEVDHTRTKYIDTLNRHQSLTELEQNKAEERYRLKRTKKCGLCFREFSVVNLVLSVPQKAIIDLQNTWEEKFSWVVMTPAEREKYQNPALLRPTLIYNEVRVCVYCAQFFQNNQQDVYRPSYESKMAERRMKATIAAEESARAYWDPLTTVERERKEELDRLEETQRLAASGVGSTAELNADDP